MGTVLVVDDDPVLAYGVQRALEAAGYAVLVALNGEAALRTAREVRLSLIILDLLMPRMDGLEVLHWLRADPLLAEVSTLMLTPPGWQQGTGGSPPLLETMGKPFVLEELVERVRARVEPGYPVRDVGPGHPVHEARPEYSIPEARPSTLSRREPLTVDLRAFVLQGEHGSVRLTPTEFRLLRCLLERPGEVVSVSELLAEVWGYAAQEGGPELVRAHVRNLRGKIQRVGGSPRQILQTVPRHGYTLALGA